MKVEFRLTATEAAPGLLEAEDESNRTIYIQPVAFLSNEHIQSAAAITDERGQPTIHVVFTPEGAQVMATVTGEHVGEQIAILVDGVVINAPFLAGALDGGFARIGGNFTEEEARRIAAGITGSVAPPVRRGNIPPSGPRQQVWDPEHGHYHTTVERTETEIDVAVDILETYVGEYELPQFLIAVTLEAGALFVEPRGEPKMRLFAESETQFFLRNAEVQLSFTSDEGGEVIGVVLHEGDTDHEGRKVR